ncbi:MAG TPA: hypothetical protein VGF98_05450 [Candidatus Tumulicola sp.]
MRGIRGGILTTRYPSGGDEMPQAYRGAIEALPADVDVQRRAAAACLSGAIIPSEGRAVIDPTRCFQCGECARAFPEAFQTTSTFELALTGGDPHSIQERLAKRVRTLGRSIHLRHVDAGSDGSEEQELAAIFNPYYDANRLGIFLTATPRHADVLVVTGAVTQSMREPLLRTFDAMPNPKVVIALGTTACSGGIFAAAGGAPVPVRAVLDVDVMIPGAPPAPLSILHGLWVALGRSDARGTFL